MIEDAATSSHSRTKQGCEQEGPPTQEESNRRANQGAHVVLLCLCWSPGLLCYINHLGPGVFALVMEVGGSGEIFNIYGPLRVVWELKD